MPTLIERSLVELNQQGYTLLPDIFDVHELASLTNRLSETVDGSDASALQSRGHIYGSRNLLATCPEIATLLQNERLNQFISTVLGPHAGLVRVLYFDKPPGRSWSLPWHKDRTIAVQRNDLPSDLFTKPTTKAGVAHVEAPEKLLGEMLTLRLHVDAMTAENGPLSVIPGSHLRSDNAPSAPVELHASAGTVLAMRPLLSHASSQPQQGCTLHRRVIHFELAGRAELADGYAWYLFDPVVHDL